MQSIWADAAKFEAMAAGAGDPRTKAAFKNQAEQYRKMALARAEQLGISPDDVVPGSESHFIGTAHAPHQRIYWVDSRDVRF